MTTMVAWKIQNVFFFHRFLTKQNGDPRCMRWWVHSNTLRSGYLITLFSSGHETCVLLCGYKGSKDRCNIAYILWDQIAGSGKRKKVVRMWSVDLQRKDVIE